MAHLSDAATGKTPAAHRQRSNRDPSKPASRCWKEVPEGGDWSGLKQGQVRQWAAASGNGFQKGQGSSGSWRKGASTS